MKRETVNKLRFILEEMIPPIIRDSAFMRFIFRLAWGDHILRLEAFKANAALNNQEEYDALYKAHPRVQDETDNSQACIDAIIEHAEGPKICDIGCGTGAVISAMMSLEKFKNCEFSGLDMMSPEEFIDYPFDYSQGKIEQLPYEDNYFDTVICTHVLEHILDLRHAVKELRRIAKRQLIIIVPREREYRFTFNPHFHFFPYQGTLLRSLIPLPRDYAIESIGRDFFYMEKNYLHQPK